MSHVSEQPRGLNGAVRIAMRSAVAKVTAHRGQEIVVRDSSPIEPKGRLRRALPLVLSVGGLVATILLATSALWRYPGLPIFGDWVPPDSAYLKHISSVWNLYEHNGMMNVDLRALPWLGLHALLAGPPDGGAFRIVSDAFVFVAIAFPSVTAFWVILKTLRASYGIAILGSLLYGLNPWVAGQFASGHFPMLLGYGLLPLVAHVALTRQGLSFVARSGLLVGALLGLDIHSAILACLILGLGRIVSRGHPLGMVRDLGGAAGLCLLLSAYWVVPTALALSRLPYKPISLPPNTNSQATLAQMADPLHVLATRANWWTPFSDGLFAYGWFTWVISAAILLLPVTLIVYSLSNRRAVRHPFGVMGIGLVSLGALPQVFAHFAPSIYAGLSRVPLGASFRDVNDLTPLYIIGLACLAVAWRPAGWTLPAIAGITCAAALLPWLSGDLRGDARPVVINDGQVSALKWLDAHATPSSQSLWLPLDQYVKFPWSTFPVSDPIRFWSERPVLNPVGDPAYDFSPDVTSSLINLEWVSARPHPGGQLAQILAHAGIRYVVTRPAVESSDITADQDRTLRSSPGIRLAQVFGSVNIYEVLPTPRPEVQAVDSVGLFDGSWVSLGNATEFDPGLSRLYVRANTPAASSIALNSGVAVALGNSPWQLLFGMTGPTPPPDYRGREAYPFDPGLAYAYEAGQSITFRSRGIAAVRLLGSNREASLSCDSGNPSSVNPLVLEQPDASPRWYALRCDGLARLSLSGHVFVQGYETLSIQEFEDRLNLLRTLISRGGSGYVIQGPKFSSNLVAQSNVGSGDVTAATWREDPLFLSSGLHRFVLRCTEGCPKGSVELVPVGQLAEEFHSAGMSKGNPTLVPVGGGGTSVTTVREVSSGAYQLLVHGLPIDRIELLSIERLPDIHPQTTALAPLSQSQASNFGSATVVAVNHSLGPWSIELSNGRKATPFPADLLGFAYIANGLSSTLSLEEITRFAYLGALVGLVALIASFAALAGLPGRGRFAKLPFLKQRNR